ncbi:MAG: PAS domain S-box protein [Methylocystaceae bacterium]|nr:PAS domain S-box protein [Methylocystaceae bacterium]
MTQKHRLLTFISVFALTGIHPHYVYAQGWIKIGQDHIFLLFTSGVLLGALACGYYFKQKAINPDDTQNHQSPRYLAAIERISQGFTLFLQTTDKTTQQQALEWLLREAAKTLDVSLTNLWLYDERHFTLTLRYSFDKSTTEHPLGTSINKDYQPAFFGALRGERTVPFNEVRHDFRCTEFLSVLPANDKPESMLVALVGVGKHATGTLHICARSGPREWTDSDRQFAGSIADMIAFYLSSRSLQTTQKALYESETRFRDMVEASSDWYWETGPDHKFNYISPRFTTLTGITRETFMGTTRYNFSNPDSLPGKWHKHWDDLKNHRPFRSFEYDITFNDTLIKVSINGKPIFDEKGKFLGYRGTGSNITESVNFRTRYEETLNALPNGLVIWDRNDYLSLWNTTAVSMFPALKSHLHKPLTFRDMMRLTHSENIIKYPAPLDESALDYTVKAHKACGHREIELTNGRYLIVHEHPTSEGGIVGIYTDITNLKERETQLIESNTISRALSFVRNTLVHARNESFILSEICRIIVEIGDFDAAWISLLKMPGNLPEFLDVNMHKGKDLGLKKYKPSSTLKQAYIKQRTMVLNEGILHQAFPDAIDAFTSHKIKSGAIFPIRMDTKIAGFLVVVSRQKNAFSDRNAILLEEMSNNIGYGLSNLRSEQHRLITEEALRESEGRYRSLIDMSPDAILVLDETEKIVFANPQGHAMFAAKNRTEVLSRRFSNYLCDNENLFKKNARIKGNEPVQTFTSVKLRRLDDEVIEVDITSRPVSYAGLATRLLILRDVTERNRVNEQLAQTSKLATLGEMAAGITHELSQPLNIMRFAAEGSMLKMRRGTLTMEQVNKQFDLISMQSQRMADIIDHMRVFSRKDTGSIEVFDPALVIRQSVDMVEAQYLAENIHLDVRYPPYYSLLKGRPIQLEQVILNLITNARDAINQRKKDMDDDNSETMRIDVNMTYDQAENKINIAVTDSGSGIPPKALAKLFDPFFTTKEVGKGTGLGLSVSYGIIAAMGGHIQARNIHKGARFDISLPCVEQSAPLSYKKAKNVVDLDLIDDEAEDDFDLDMETNGINVLVVDDEVYAAEAMMEYLFTNGYNVDMAGDGEEALELYDSEPCDIVVTDIRMPRMDGRLLMKKLKKRNPNLPVIVVTGHTGMEGNDLEDINELAFCVMKKPVSLAELVTQVNLAAKTLPQKDC